MLKILMILVICYVIITSTDSRSMNISENNFINDRNSSKYIFQTRFNNTDEKSKNFTTSEHITHFEPAGSQNNSHVSNINQTSAIEDKSISIKENENKEVFDPLNGKPFVKEFRTGRNNATEESKNITASENIIYVNLTDLQNNSKISNVSNTNQTSAIEDKSINLKENETKECFDSLNSTSYLKEFRTRFNNATEESKNITARQFIIDLILADLQNNSKKCTGQNQTSVIEDIFINVNETKQFLDPLGSRTPEQGLTPNLFPKPENNVTTNNTKSVTPEDIGNRISTTAIITLTGGSPG